MYRTSNRNPPGGYCPRWNSNPCSALKRYCCMWRGLAGARRRSGQGVCSGGEEEDGRIEADAAPLFADGMAGSRRRSPADLIRIAPRNGRENILNSDPLLRPRFRPVVPARRRRPPLPARPAPACQQS